LRDNFRRDLEEVMNYFIESETTGLIESLKNESWVGSNFISEIDNQLCGKI
jgi:hypothetical protein